MKITRNDYTAQEKLYNAAAQEKRIAEYVTNGVNYPTIDARKDQNANEDHTFAQRLRAYIEFTVEEIVEEAEAIDYHTVLQTIY